MKYAHIYYLYLVILQINPENILEMTKHYTTSLLIQLTLPVFLVFLDNFNLSAQNFVTTYAGDGISGFVNGDTSTARFTTPFGMCIDKNGNLFIADQDNNCIRKITAAGIVSTHAGSGVAGYTDGDASIAQFNLPINVCVDDTGNVYVSDFQNQRIRKISASGIVTTVAGNGTEGHADGPALSASFDYPRGICIDQQGNLYIGDSWNHRIRKVSTSGEVSTYAGGGNSFGVQSMGDYLDGNDTSARFYTPCGLSIDNSGNIYVADAYNHRVRVIDPSRVVTTLAGSGLSGSANGGFADGDAATARFNTLTEVFVMGGEKVFVGDTYNQRIRLVNDGFVTTVAGNGTPGFVNGIDSLAKFNRPRGVVLDSTGSYVYVCDNLNHVIRKITLGFPTGTEQAIHDPGINIFPNPTSGNVFFTGNLLFNEIHLTSISGKEIFSEKYSYSPALLNFTNYQDGIYFLSLYGRFSGLKTVKLVISH